MIRPKSARAKAAIASHMKKKRNAPLKEASPIRSQDPGHLGVSVQLSDQEILANKEKNGPGFSKLHQDRIYDMAAEDCTQEEIAWAMGCSVNTLETHCHELVKKGEFAGKASIRSKMHEMAMKGNVPMLIWLSKQRLQYRDKPADEVTSTHFNVFINELPWSK
jgi:hypothetical protein